MDDGLVVRLNDGLVVRLNVAVAERQEGERGCDRKTERGNGIKEGGVGRKR